MEILQNKIDFALVIAVHHANPNGDPSTAIARARPMKNTAKFRTFVSSGRSATA